MDTKRLSERMEQALSKQMNVEDLQSRIYYALGIWADDAGYGGISNFLFRHAQEERTHMVKFMEYVLKRGGKPTITALPAPTDSPNCVADVFQAVWKHEVENTEKIYDLVNLALEEKDWATFNFLQWFVKEQIEEETLAQDLLDQVKIAGGENASPDALLQLDRVVGNAPDDADLARDATAENP